MWYPFLGFLGRHRALEILAFVFFYKFADNLAQALWAFGFAYVFYLAVEPYFRRLWPERLASTSPAYLRRDFRDNYVVMVASAYETEGDLDAARDRLALLDAKDPARPAVELAERLAQVGGSIQDIARLEHLVAALVAPPSTADPSAEGR